LAPDGAGIGLDGAGDDLEQRRFPGAVASDDRDPLSRVDLEGDAIQQRQVTEGDGDGIQGEQGHCRGGGGARRGGGGGGGGARGGEGGGGGGAGPGTRPGGGRDEAGRRPGRARA